MAGLAIIAVFAAVLAAAAFGLLFLREYRARRAYVRSLGERALTVDRLLDFSQTIQGAGRPDQIYPTLCDFLRGELNLAGLTVLSYDAEALPTTQLRASWPDDLVSGTSSMAEMDSSQCPCLRQSLPWQFTPGGSPVRCGIDGCIRLPASHAAYCIPFNIGRKMQVAVHMLLEAGRTWTEQRRQLAQAYVNSAHAALSALHLLAEAEKQSMTDALTGLFNRRSMDQLLIREVALCERHGAPLSVVMIDLDHFKEINDTHGHAAGDHMLKSFADCVRITLRKTDLAFRYGGDEFVIALPQTPLAQAQQVVQKLRQAFLAVDFSHAISRLDRNPTLSIGVAERSKDVNVLTLPQLLAAADHALYAAKNANRNCIKVYEPPKAA